MIETQKLIPYQLPKWKDWIDCSQERLNFPLSPKIDPQQQQKENDNQHHHQQHRLKKAKKKNLF